MKQIPNLFTLLNLIFGCLAIVFILQTGESIVLLQQEGFTDVNLPEKITWGCFFIFAARPLIFWMVLLPVFLRPLQPWASSWIHWPMWLVLV